MWDCESRKRREPTKVVAGFVTRLADDGNVQADFSSEPGARIGLGGDDVATRGQEKNVVKRKTFWDGFRDHTLL